MYIHEVMEPKWAHVSHQVKKKIVIIFQLFKWSEHKYGCVRVCFYTLESPLALTNHGLSLSSLLVRGLVHEVKKKTMVDVLAFLLFSPKLPTALNLRCSHSCAAES